MDDQGPSWEHQSQAAREAIARIRDAAQTFRELAASGRVAVRNSLDLLSDAPNESAGRDLGEGSVAGPSGPAAAAPRRDG